MARPRRHPAATLALLVAAGCLSEAGGGPGPADQVLSGATEPLFTVGRAEGDGPDVFGRVRDVAFAPDGSLLVLDDRTARVVAFDPAGAWRHTLGRPGEGPGELAQPLAVVATGAGEVAVWDLRARALHVFGADGEPRGRIPLDPSALGIDAETLSPWARDGVAFVGGSSYFEEPDSLPVYALALERGAEPRVVAHVPNPQSTPQSEGITRRRDGTMSMTRRLHASYAPQAHLAPLPDGRLAVAAGYDYRILVLGPDGVVEAVRTRSIDPRPLTDDDRRRETERRGAAMREAFGGAAGSFSPAAMTDEDVRAALDAMIFPDSVPVVRRLLSGPRGLMLVLRTAPDSPDPGPIDVFRPGGEYLGTLVDVPFPDALGPGGVAARILEDDLGVHRVEVVRLSALAGPR